MKKRAIAEIYYPKKSPFWWSEDVATRKEFFSKVDSKIPPGYMINWFHYGEVAEKIMGEALAKRTLKDTSAKFNLK